MCLDLITKRIRSSNKERTAYKVFSIHPISQHLRFLWYGIGDFSLLDDKLVPQDVLLRARKNDETADSGEHYKTGFHCFVSRKSALRLTPPGVVVKVKVRKVRIIGKERDSQVIVADEMFVPSSSDKFPKSLKKVKKAGEN